MEPDHQASVLRTCRGFVAPGREGAMSKLNIRIALIVLATVLSTAGYAAAKGGGHGGGGHGGGGHGGGGHGGGGYGGGSGWGGFAPGVRPSAVGATSVEDRRTPVRLRDRVSTAIVLSPSTT